MKKCLYALLVIQVITLAIGIFALLSQSIFYAILLGLLGALEIVPIIAIIDCLNTNEQHSNDISYIYYKLKQLENEEQSDNDNPLPILNRADTPRKPWKCIKCDTVNKAADSVCSGCKAEYSYLNPTYEPDSKHKSRFVKFK